MNSLIKQTCTVALLGLVLSAAAIVLRGLPAATAAAAETQSCAAPDVLSLKPRKITTAEASALSQRGEATFVDCRSPAEYQAGHVAGAISLPAERLQLSEASRRLLMTGQTVVAYCDAACSRSTKVAHHLMEGGFDDVRILEGGLGAWVEDGYPAESGPCALCTADP